MYMSVPVLDRARIRGCTLRTPNLTAVYPVFGLEVTAPPLSSTDAKRVSRLDANEAVDLQTAGGLEAQYRVQRLRSEEAINRTGIKAQVCQGPLSQLDDGADASEAEHRRSGIDGFGQRSSRFDTYQTVDTEEPVVLEGYDSGSGERTEDPVNGTDGVTEVVSTS